MSGLRRILFLNNQGLRAVGGGVGILRAVTDSLARDHEVVLASEDPPCGAAFAEVEIPRYRAATDARWRLNPWRKAQHLKRVLDPALIRSADLVIALDTHFAPALAATPARRLIHLSLSCVTRQEWFASFGSGRYWYGAQYALLERSLLKRAEAVVVASPMHARELVSFAGGDPRRMHVMPPVFATARPAPRAVPRDLLVALSRITPVKNLGALIPLLARLPGTRLAMIGDGEAPETLQARAAELGVAERIEWVGAVDDPSPWLDRATLLLHPSRYESFGMAVHEAMRHGAVPVVFGPGRGRMSAAAELVTHGATGLHADFGNLDAAARDIADLLADPQRLAAMAVAARAAAEARDTFDYAGAFRALVERGWVTP